MSEKEYATFPLEDSERNIDIKNITHAKLRQDRLSGKISGNFITRQPLHVSEGVLVAPSIPSAIPLVKAFARTDNRRTVSGSSLKGAIRSLVELFTYACLPHEKNSRCKASREVCIACALFGTLGHEGNVYFEHAPQLDAQVEILQAPAQYNKKSKRDERRYYPHNKYSLDDATVPLEVVPVNSRFRFDLSFRNLSKAELGILLIGLGATGIRPKLGGFKNAGLGAIEFQGGDGTFPAVQILDIKKSYSQSAYAYQKVDLDSYIKAAKTHRIPKNLANLERDLGEEALNDRTY